MSYRAGHIIDVVIPAYNEESSIINVIRDLPRNMLRNIIVCDNGSTDNTKVNALSAGAIVITEHRKGYGRACLSAIDYIKDQEAKPDVVLFIDGDYSDYPEQSVNVLAPIIEKDYDLVIGSRVLGQLQKGAMTPVQIFGNWLATNLIRIIYNYHFTDLGPFRAISYAKLIEIDMNDEDFGWTVEMQVKAAKHKLKCTEVPVDYRKRIGKSKVSGTIKGSILAGHKILWTIFKLI